MNRREFSEQGAGAFFIAASGRTFGANAPSNRVRLAIVGCNEKGRGFSVMRNALKAPGVEIAWVCDVDSRARMAAAAEVERLTGMRPRQEKDLRKVLEDPLLDGIISETPDHWHAYSAVLAMQAGKHVYVEKPCCFCPREGEILVDVWRKTGRVLQVGSQRRSDKSYVDAMNWLHGADKPLGELSWAKCWYMADRSSIGRGKPAAVPDWLDWDLWQGPAPRTEFRDNVVHYNWHWFRRWGTAETGNNAPHYVDIARWALGVKFPQRVTSSGGLIFPCNGDDFEWPDTYNVSYEYPEGKLVTLELTTHAGAKPYMDLWTGAMIYGERGCALFSPMCEVLVFDRKGKDLIRAFRQPATVKEKSLTDPTACLDTDHMADFADCIRRNDQKTRTPADEGYMSSYMPLIGNIALDIRESLDIDPASGRPVNSAAAMKAWAREYEKGWDLLCG